MKFDGVINFADVNIKRQYLAQLGALTVPHEIVMKPYSPRRSNQANRYYFGVVVKSLCQFMEEQGENWSPERAHEFIVRRVLGTEDVIDHRTGEVLDTVRKETHHLSKAEFSEFVEQAHAWLADFGIIVPSKSEFEEMEKQCRHTTASC